MNIDFKAAFDAGMTEEDIKNMMERALASAMEERKAQEAARLEEERKKATARDKEVLKAEGRAYLINAVIAYVEAFDLLDEGEVIDDELVAEIEEHIMKLEAMIPLWKRMHEIQEEFDIGHMFGM